jgi:hypothetical protein
MCLQNISDDGRSILNQPVTCKTIIPKILFYTSQACLIASTLMLLYNMVERKVLKNEYMYQLDISEGFGSKVYS